MSNVKDIISVNESGRNLTIFIGQVVDNQSTDIFPGMDAQPEIRNIGAGAINDLK